MARGTGVRRKRLYDDAQRSIRARYSELDLGIEDVAADVGTSTRHLQRVLREIGQTTFRQTLLEIRMKKARQLLARKRRPLPIHQVAPRVGYRRPSGLRQAFRRYWGCNPSEVQPAPPEELWYEIDRRR